MLSRCLLVLMLWWCTEDFDFAVHQAALAGLCIGLLSGAIDEGRRRSVRQRWQLT
jgi:hypothetical protein